MKRKIYIASSWKNSPFVRGLAVELRRRGHEVFDFTDTENRPDGLDIFVFSAGQWALQHGKKPDEIEYKDFLTWEPAIRAFESDKAGLDWANTVIMLLPCGRSSHLEAGYAVGQDKELFIFGDLPLGEFDVMYGFANQCFWKEESFKLFNELSAETCDNCGNRQINGAIVPEFECHIDGHQAPTNHYCRHNPSEWKEVIG